MVLFTPYTSSINAFLLAVVSASISSLLSSSPPPPSPPPNRIALLRLTKIGIPIASLVVIVRVYSAIIHFT